jgi:hypothetical protein
MDKKGKKKSSIYKTIHSYSNYIYFQRFERNALFQFQNFSNLKQEDDGSDLKAVLLR